MPMRDALSGILNLDDAERAASGKLPRSVMDFYRGGADDEVSLQANRQAFRDLRLRPAVLNGVHRPDLKTRLFGQAYRLPLVIAPMGAVGIGRRSGDIDLARAANAAEIPHVLSTVSSASIESVAAENLRGTWFQLYPLLDRDHMWALVDRVAKAGCTALVLTVDVPVGGKRERDLRNDFVMPFRFTPRNVLGFAARPRWALDMLRHGVPRWAHLDAADDKASSRTSSVGAGFDPAFSWSGLDELRARWRGPLLVKGVLRPEDATRAVRAGVDGLIVSNHGGRQLDGAVSSTAVMKDIRRAVGASLPLLLDGGVRRGTDVLKSLALGATAVMVGRPMLYGACVAGAPGVRRIIDILEDEIRRSMVLCGAENLAALDADLVCDGG